MTPRRGMVLTVGTGTRPDVDMSAPLARSVREANPDRVVLVITEESAPVARRVREQVSGVERWHEVPLASADDIGEAFQACIKAIRWLLGEGLQPDQVTADYTSGTKSMTAGLALAAVALRCGSLRYIAGERDTGVVVSGTERFLVTPPAAVLALDDLRLAEELIRRLQFDTAQRVCEAVNVHLLLYDDRQRQDALLTLARAYEFWDRFRHHEAVDRFQSLRDAPAPPDLLPDRRTVQRLKPIGDAAYMDVPTSDLLADLIANAQRRLLEGRWDDAVARLYRAAEMLAQMVLWERYRQRTGDLDLDRLPEAARSLAQTDAEGRARVGLERAYRVLEAYGERLGQRFYETVRRYLSQRNDSILAHGQKPVGREAAEGFLYSLLALVRDEVPDIDERVRALQFPWLVAESPSRRE